MMEPLDRSYRRLLWCWRAVVVAWLVMFVAWFITFAELREWL